MSAHRLQAYFQASSPDRITTVVAPCAFVPCPVALLNNMSAAQQQFVQEVYRLAWEKVEAQARPRHTSLYTFSVN